MADFKVSQLPSTSAADDGDYFIINKGNSTTSRINFTDILSGTGDNLDSRYVLLDPAPNTLQTINGTGGLRVAGIIDARLGLKVNGSPVDQNYETGYYGYSGRGFITVDGKVRMDMWGNGNIVINENVEGSRSFESKTTYVPDANGFSSGFCDFAIMSDKQVNGKARNHSGFRTLLNATGKGLNYINGFEADFTETEVNNITGYATGFLARSAIGDRAPFNYGYLSYINKALRDEDTNLTFNSAGTAQSFHLGDVYIGGNISRNTFDVWKSTLTEEEVEQYEAGTLIAPANVTTPGDGSYIRQWWYNQQSAEDRALIDEGLLEYPTSFRAENFTNTFALGDNARVHIKGGNDVTSGDIRTTGKLLVSTGAWFDQSPILSHPDVRLYVQGTPRFQHTTSYFASAGAKWYKLGTWKGFDNKAGSRLKIEFLGTQSFASNELDDEGTPGGTTTLYASINNNSPNTQPNFSGYFESTGNSVLAQARFIHDYENSSDPRYTATLYVKAQKFSACSITVETTSKSVFINDYEELDAEPTNDTEEYISEVKYVGSRNLRLQYHEWGRVGHLMMDDREYGYTAENQRPHAQLDIVGGGQLTADLVDNGSRGASIMLSGGSSSMGSGGAVLFGNMQSRVSESIGFAAIKGLLLNGSEKTTGHLAISTRPAVGSDSLAERIRITADGKIGINSKIPQQYVHIAQNGGTPSNVVVEGDIWCKPAGVDPWASDEDSQNTGTFMGRDGRINVYKNSTDTTGNYFTGVKIVRDGDQTDEEPLGSRVNMFSITDSLLFSGPPALIDNNKISIGVNTSGMIHCEKIYSGPASRDQAGTIMDNTGVYGFHAGTSAPSAVVFPHGTMGATGRSLEVHSGLQINLDVDNPANFTINTTTDDDGNEVYETIYTGPSIDVKERLETKTAALAAIKAAAEDANITTLDEFKTAIAAALANI